MKCDACGETKERKDFAPQLVHDFEICKMCEKDMNQGLAALEIENATSSIMNIVQEDISNKRKVKEEAA